MGAPSKPAPTTWSHARSGTCARTRASNRPSTTSPRTSACPSSTCSACSPRGPAGHIVRDDDEAARVADRIFGASAAARPLHVLLKGTNFQVQVWKALVRIKPGETMSYGALANAVGKPGASRAIGGAVAAN